MFAHTFVRTRIVQITKREQNSVGVRRYTKISDLLATPAVRFVGLVTNRKNYLVPSTSNQLGLLQYDRVKLDPGCNSLLLPLAGTKDIDFLLNTYPPTSGYNWVLAESIAGKTNFALVIAPVGRMHFPVSLAMDHFAGITCYVPHLMFFLSMLDLDYLLSKKIKKLMLGPTYAHAVAHVQEHHRVVSRRDYVLLGQAVLNQFHTIGTPECCFYIDPTVAPSLSDFCGGSWENVADTAFQVKMAAAGASQEVARLMDDMEDLLGDKEELDHAHWSDEPIHSDDWNDYTPFVCK